MAAQILGESLAQPFTEQTQKDLPVVDVADGVLFDMERREPMFFAFCQNEVNQGRIAIFVAHDFNR